MKHNYLTTNNLALLAVVAIVIGWACVIGVGAALGALALGTCFYGIWYMMHTKKHKVLTKKNLVVFAAIVGLVVFAFGMSSLVRAQPENENSFIDPLMRGDWWSAISQVYTIGGVCVLWIVLIVLPVGMLYIKTRNSGPPTILLILGSGIFGVLFRSSIALEVMFAIFIALGIGILLFGTFTKKGGY